MSNKKADLLAQAVAPRADVNRLVSSSKRVHLWPPSDRSGKPYSNVSFDLPMISGERHSVELIFKGPASQVRCKFECDQEEWEEFVKGKEETFQHKDS
jgi:hypothetical protein